MGSYSASVIFITASILSAARGWETTDTWSSCKLHGLDKGTFCGIYIEHATLDIPAAVTFFNATQQGEGQGQIAMLHKVVPLSSVQCAAAGNQDGSVNMSFVVTGSA